ncbi:PD-(D/E)XK nuclease family protein [Brachyspira catarrhinii]|uniref:PD-(D/E)XK nuclease family protein n=1 Tax=Brachyspira catarrhinii TaxID=2528966 RepID=A0ABY2TTP9_9SPIR|nr:PD-(D/E)XK nuclease family protein [Brachyspira catarrhinii]TKZ36269.1 hypothetical protein EZH24_01040 [Brachyspira catarrhinii]
MAEFDKRLDLLKNIIDNKDKIFEKINEEKEKLIPIVNITNILGCATDEVKNSSLLHNILKIKFKYENKEINFAKDFSEFIIKEKLKNDSVSINSTAEAYNEFYASSETWRRIDLFIHSDNFEIIIENKIWAGDQPNQLKDYYNNRINENKNNNKIKDNIFIVYLTRNRDKPSEFSIDRELIAELENKNKICYLSHDDIAEWIKNDILNKYQFLKDEKFQLIYSALIQIAYNEKYISKKTEENKMELNEIKKYVDFDLLLKDENDLDKKVNELNKSIELFKNAKKLIADKKGEIILETESVKKGIRYSVDVGNYLKQEGINNIIFNEEAIRRDIKNGFSLNIRIPITPIWHHLYISLEQGVSSLSITISGTNGNFINKVKEEDIKKKITEILNGYDEEGEGGDDECIYGKNINIENDKPEDTAQKMIDLYKLLEKIN